jgi:uncharacterized PurR-regulated membrane protein YhhQ (DUF165 family)
MWPFLLGLLFGRVAGVSRYMRYVFAVFAVGVVIAGLIYVCVVFNAVSERSKAPHVHAHGTH